MKKISDEADDISTSRALTAKDLYKRYAASLVAVISINADGDEGIGSAFHIGDGVFVTARHVVEGMQSCKIEVDRHLIGQLEGGAPEKPNYEAPGLIAIAPKSHPDTDKDVAVFSVPQLASLPAVPLGSHLDDSIDDHAFVLNEVLVLGFPPIPLSSRNVLVAMRAQINAVVDLINVKHVHFIASATARGGLSGGVVLSEWNVALGVVTSSLLKNGLPEELGYLTILTVEPILECLAAHRLLPRSLTELWDGLFTAEEEHFGIAEVRWAHSWIETDRDGHRARITFSTPSDIAIAAMRKAIAARGDFNLIEQAPGVITDVWQFEGDYGESEAPLEAIRQTLRAILLAEGYDAVEHPVTITHSLEPPAHFGRIA